MDSIGIIVFLIGVLSLGWIIVGTVGKDFTDTGQEPTDPVLENPPNTELARKVWSAHTANQTLDMAILTGNPSQIRDAEAKATVANSRLVAYLTEKAEQ